MKKLPNSKIAAFAVGQLGWAILSGLISNWLVYFYQPDITAQEAGQTLFVPQGRVLLGVMNVSEIAVEIFNLCFWSCPSKSSSGRRIPFLKWAAFPLAASTVLVFCAPVGQTSAWNVVWLSVFVFGYYLSITAYCRSPVWNMVSAIQ